MLDDFGVLQHLWKLLENCKPSFLRIKRLIKIVHKSSPCIVLFIFSILKGKENKNNSCSMASPWVPETKQ